MKNQALLILILLLSTTACSWLPKPHKFDVPQGNVLKADKLEQLKIGMNKSQVIFLLGNPAINDPFNHNRWDYLFLLTPGRGEPQRSHLRLHFNGDTLSNIDNQYSAATKNDIDQESAEMKKQIKRQKHR